jgi:hypothetical protein
MYFALKRREAEQYILHVCSVMQYILRPPTVGVCIQPKTSNVLVCNCAANRINLVAEFFIFIFIFIYPTTVYYVTTPRIRLVPVGHSCLNIRILELSFALDLYLNRAAKAWVVSTLLRSLKA